MSGLWRPDTERRLWLPGMSVPVGLDLASIPTIPTIPGSGIRRIAGGKGSGGKGSGGTGSGGGSKGGGGNRDRLAPTLSSATINAAGTQLTLVFSESVTGVSAADFALSTGQALSNAQGSGTTWTLDCEQVYQGTSPTLSYSGTAVQDLGGNRLATFAGAAITNNSTVAAGPGTLLTGFDEYWPLTEASGNRTGAHSGIILTDNNTVGSRTGFGGTGTAADFVRASLEYLSKTDAAAISYGDEDFSIFFWVQFDALIANMAPISRFDTGADDRQFLFWYTGTRFQFRVSSTGTATWTDVDANALGAPAINTPYFVVLDHDATNNQIGIQVNNGTRNTASHSGGMFNGATPLNVGRWSGGDYFDGMMGGLGMVRRLLTANEKTWLHAGGAGPRTYAEIYAASP